MIKSKNLEEKVARILRETGQKVFSNRAAFRPQRGDNVSKVQKITMRKPVSFASRAEALARKNNIFLGTRSVGKDSGQRLVIVGRRREKSFTGALAQNRLRYIPTHRLGGEHVAVDWYVSEDAFLLVVDAHTYAKWIRSGSPRGAMVPLEWWEERVMSNQYINLVDHHSGPRSERFFECLLSIHAQNFIVKEVYQSRYPVATQQLSRLMLSVMISMLDEGCCESSVTQLFKSAVEVIHKDTAQNDIEMIIRNWPEELKITAFRFRRSLYSDSWDPIELQQKAVKRLQLEPITLSERGENILNLWKECFSDWIRRKPGQVERCRKLTLHKSSGSFLALRREGGGSRELQLIVALYRLHLGKSSPLQDVFGLLSSKDDLESSLKKVGRLDEDEIIAACVWWCHLIVERDWPNGMMVSIFPDREAKGRTFCVPWVCGEILSSPAVKLVKAFLLEQPEAARALTRDNQQFNALVARATQGGENFQRCDSDSEAATDYYSETLVKEFYQPAIQALPAWVETGISCCQRRGKIALSLKRKSFLDYLNVAAVDPVTVMSADEARTSSSYPHSAHAFSTRKGLPVDLVKHETRVIDQATRGPFVLKAYTGAGKTSWLASQTGCVLSLPTITQCIALKSTLEFAGVSYECYWSGLKRPAPESEKAIICTPAHVEGLLRDNPNRFYVCDEAETPNDDALVAMRWCLTSGRFFVACSATPDILELPLLTLELFGASPFKIKEEECPEAEMPERIFELEGQCLIVVHSEPKAIEVEKRLLRKRITAKALLSAMTDDQVENCLKSPVIVATNKVRSSITLPALTAVFDYQRRYVFTRDAMSYIMSGVVTQVTSHEITQLRGRLGRVADGTYYQVEHKLPGCKIPTCIHDVGASAQSIQRIDPGHSPLPFSKGSLDYVVTTYALCTAYLGKQTFTRGLPPTIKLIQKSLMTDVMRVRIGLIYCFESFGFRQKLLELSRSGVEELEALGGQFDAALSRDADFSRPFVRVFHAFLEHGLYYREISMACRWLKIPCTVEGLGSLDLPYLIEESSLAMSLLSILLWETAAEPKGNEYHGIFSKFRCPRSDGHNEVALLLGRSYDRQTGTIVYARAVATPCRTLLQDLFEKAKDVPRLTYSQARWHHQYFSLERSGGRPHMVASNQAPQTLSIVNPDQLSVILDVIDEKIQEFAYDFPVVTSGVNMASRISPRMLLGLCWTVGAYVQLNVIPGLLFEVFGDDFAGMADTDKDILKEISEARAEFGLRKKDSASATQKDPRTLTVITERFFNGERGEVEGIKPSNFVKLFASQRPDWIAALGKLEPSDYMGDYQKLQHLLPDGLKKLGLNDPTTFGRRRRRITASRQFALHLVRTWEQNSPLISNAADIRDVDALVNQLEQTILVLMPSTRGSSDVFETSDDTLVFQHTSYSTITQIKARLEN